jgi:hypothetical protein
LILEINFKKESLFLALEWQFLGLNCHSKVDQGWRSSRGYNNQREPEIPYGRNFAGGNGDLRPKET